MVFLLSLCSAVAYGLSDFVGGLLTRRASVWAVAATSQATAAVLALGLIMTNAGEPRAGDVLWGVLAGLVTVATVAAVHACLETEIIFETIRRWYALGR